MGPNRFVITGLPRSRTAWFAAYLTQGDVICYHEALYHGIQLTGFPHVGTADCGYALGDWDIGPHKLVIIHRDHNEVANSLRVIGLPDETGYLPVLAERLYELDGLHIEFSEIDEKIKDIHDYLGLPGYNKKRAELFKSMNIQSTEWSN